jgi:hypothetical protein
MMSVAQLDYEIAPLFYAARRFLFVRLGASKTHPVMCFNHMSSGA